MGLVLVPATVEDVDDYVRIARLNTSRFNITPIDREKVLDAIARSVVYMICVDRAAVGIASYAMRSLAHAYLSELQVEPAFRGKGIGGYALAAILQELERIEVVDLLTHPENPARELYRRHGFQQVGEAIEDHRGTGEPRIRMLLVRG
jgi:ribosomal protein S18 acetylase RimI-like enzyme